MLRAAAVLVAVLAVAAAAVSARVELSAQEHAKLEAQLMADVEAMRNAPPEISAQQAMPCYACEAVSTWSSTFTGLFTPEVCEQRCQTEYPVWSWACADLCDAYGEADGDCLQAGFCDGEPINTDYRPVVLIHGFHDTSYGMGRTETAIRAAFPGIYVHNVDIGSGKMYSVLTNMNEQLAAFRQVILSDPHLAKGFDLVAHSQGGVLSRAYIQRYNSPPVFNAVFATSPLGGEFGIPGTETWTKYVKHYLETAAYSSYVQNHVAPANYWRDSFDLADYYKSCMLLPDIDNQRDYNEDYKTRFTSLHKVSVIHSAIDKIIIPTASELFGCFRDKSKSAVMPMTERDVYKQDLYGLRTLDHAGKLYASECRCAHGDSVEPPVCPEAWEKGIKPFVGNKW